MVDSKHPWKAWIYLLPAIVLLLIFTVWPIFNTVTTAFVYSNIYLPGDIQVEEIAGDGEEAYRFYYKDAQNVPHYLSATVADDGTVHLGYADKADDEKSIFTYNAELDAWFVTVGEKQYFIAATADSDAKLFEVNDANKGLIEKNELYTASLIKKEGDIPVSSALDTALSYNFGVFKGIPVIINYAVTSGENGVLNMTNELEQSAQFWPEIDDTGATNRFAFYVSGNSNEYLNVVANDDGSASLEYTKGNGVYFD